MLSKWWSRTCSWWQVSTGRGAIDITEYQSFFKDRGLLTKMSHQSILLLKVMSIGGCVIKRIWSFPPENGEAGDEQVSIQLQTKLCVVLLCLLAP